MVRFKRMMFAVRLFSFPLLFLLLGWGHPSPNDLPRELTEKKPIKWDQFIDVPRMPAPGTGPVWNATGSRPLLGSLLLSDASKQALWIYSLGVGISRSCTHDDLEDMRCEVMAQRTDAKVSYCDAIKSAYQSLPARRGWVFRGLGSVFKPEVMRLYQAYQSGTPTYLGVGRYHVHASASRSPKVAFEFASFISVDVNREYTIIMKIETRSGISIDAYSKYPHQQEVLLHPSAQYKILDMTPMEGYRNVLVMTLKETVSPVLSEGWCSCLKPSVRS